MELVCSHEPWCTFRIPCEGAHQVKLVIDYPTGSSQIFSLQQVRKDVWEAVLRLAPGEYRFCYHIYDGRSLTCLTPPEFETDGLKAVLHVPARQNRHRLPSHGHALRRRHPVLAHDRADLLGDVPSLR